VTFGARVRCAEVERESAARCPRMTRRDRVE